MSNRKIDLLRSQKTFRNKTQLKEYLLDIAEKNLDKEITEQHSLYPFFCDMIDRHYEISYEDGMRFVIHSDNGYNLHNRTKTPFRRSEKHRCYVYRPFRKRWDSFSLFRKCVNGRNDSPKTLLAQEYRKSIEPQIQLERLLRPKKCEICNSNKLLDVDHFPLSFNAIIHEYNCNDNGETFADFHKRIAKYRILCSKCHQKHGLRK